MRVIVGSVGYPDLCDHSAGLAVVERLAERAWPEEVSCEDLSYGPIAVMQRFQDDPPERCFHRAIFVSGVSRPGRAPGTVTVYRWDRVLPSDEEVQRAVSDAVTGIIFVDNTVIVTGYFGVLPAEVVLVEIEPLLHEFGDTLSPPVAEVIGPVCERVAELATDPSAARALPCLPLGSLITLRAETW